MTSTRRLLTTFAALFMALSAHAAQAPQGRLVVLGFDGADARTTEALMDAGELPNLDALRRSGTFAPLTSTMPSESAAAWAALNSGQNPAKTGIPGFVKRDFDEDHLPMPALGHQGHAPRATASFELSFLKRQLATRGPAQIGAIAGVAVALLFAFVFAFLLKIRRAVSFSLALALGGAAAWGGWTAAGYLPREISDVVTNPTEAGGFWEVAGPAGVPCIVLDAAMAWDRRPVENVKLLAGLGVPDARGSNGDWFVYTTDDREFARAPEGRSTKTAGKVFRVDERDGKIESYVYGPLDHWAIERAKLELAAIDAELAQPGVTDARVDQLAERRRVLDEEVLLKLQQQRPFDRTEEGRVAVPLVVTLGQGEARVSIGGSEQTIRDGAWSNWFHVDFEINPLFHVKAITRAKLVKLADPFELYVDFLQIDPADAIFWQPVSQPASFARELVDSIRAPYETVGWACMTMPFKDREIDPGTFLEDIEFTANSRSKLFGAALARNDWRAFMSVESTPDRVQHMMYQFYDREHPLHDAAKAAQRTTFFGKEIALSEAIPQSYREMDRIVGDVVKNHLKPGDTLLVCADHGFQSFRRQVDLNHWLQHEGYLVLRDNVKVGRNPTLTYVDWSKTRAYALGLGNIYLNLKGREGEGIVEPADAPALMAEMSARLLELVDPASGKKCVRAVVKSSDLHSGPHLPGEPDLMLGFEAGWRIAWSTTLADVTVERAEDGTMRCASVFDDNKLNWSGDHVSVAEDLVRGIFFSNRRVAIPETGVNLLHIAPTALSVLGVPVPKEYDLPPLEFRDG